MSFLRKELFLSKMVLETYISVQFMLWLYADILQPISESIFNPFLNLSYFTSKNEIPALSNQKENKIECIVPSSDECMDIF